MSHTLYAENILEHYRHPHRKGALASPTVTHEEVNASCGDRITLQLTIKEGKVKDAGWEGNGCAISQASMSLLSEELIGMTEDELGNAGPGMIRELLGIDVGPQRIKCALLPLHALKNALRKMKGRPPQGWRETLGDGTA
ncbi:MAG: iron-sulfur cluster assembly scaffold protein [Candidatus Peribacteraceae bacterium]|jgi:nitrogen fixation NifU-like protein